MPLIAPKQLAFNLSEKVDPRTGEVLPAGMDRLSVQLSLVARDNHAARRKIIRDYRFAVQGKARYALRKAETSEGKRFRTCDCLRSVRADKDEVLVAQSPATRSAAFHGLQTCGSVWTCPVCASKVAGKRAVEVRTAVAKHLAEGGTVLSVTYTLRHGVGHSAAELVDALAPCLKRLRSNRRVKTLRDAAGFFGSIKALEVTYGDANGWHPHIHELWFIKAPAVLVPIWQGIISSAWIAAVRTAGLPVPSSEHGCKVKVVYEARDYEAKGNSSIDGVSGWDAADELTRAVAKPGHHGRYSPFDLLVDGRFDLFREYAQAFHGKRQLTWSPGLKDLFGVDERSNDELAADEEQDGEVVLRIPKADWRVLVRHRGLDLRVSVLELVEGPGGAAAAQSFLNRLGISSTLCAAGVDLASVQTLW